MKRLFTLFFVFVVCTISFSQFSGSYNIGTGETYPTLKSFCDAVNAGTVTGDITAYITSDLTEAANVGLGVNTAGYSITFKPSADVDRTITFTQLADNTSPTGHFVIGYLGTGLSSAWSDANTIATNNVTIDGFATGGSTRRLIFTNTIASHTNARVIVVVGACENTIIKNCIINNLTTHTGSPFCVGAVVRKGTAIEVGPIGLTIENNILTATGNNVAMGARITNSGTLTTVRLTGLVFKNNVVTARRRLFEINYTTGGDIYNNEFYTIQTAAAATVTYGLWTSTGVDGTIKIYNNKFLQSNTLETSGNGHRVVSLSSGATYHIYNNMFSGMEKTSTSTTATNLTYLFYSGIAGYIYHNTFYMPALTNSSSTGYYNCINLSGNTAEIKNNIFISDEATHTNPSFISAVPTPASDYNDFYIRVSNANHKVVGTYTTLAAYQVANPTKDANSKDVDVNFVSSTDLHLAGSSNGDANLLGTTITLLENILYDIDGDLRLGAPQGPYMGADEASNPLPIELKYFNASVDNGQAKLSWQTITEINSSMFEVQRQSENSIWSKIADIPAAGNSNSPKDYSYTDKKLAAGKYQYRLKMIDANGIYKYSDVVEIEITMPREFVLSQNYPNPFNPSTVINYTIPFETEVRLEVYSVNGELVKTLVSGTQIAGNYSVELNASDLASGTYIYRLAARDFVQSKKMQLIK